MKQIEDIEKDIKNLLDIFTDLDEIVKKDNRYINIIEESISKIKDDIGVTESDVKKYNNYKIINTILTLGVSSFLILCDPFITIPSLICGGVIGYYHSINK